MNRFNYLQAGCNIQFQFLLITDLTYLHETYYNNPPPPPFNYLLSENDTPPPSKPIKFENDSAAIWPHDHPSPLQVINDQPLSVLL